MQTRNMLKWVLNQSLILDFLEFRTVRNQFFFSCLYTSIIFFPPPTEVMYLLKVNGQRSFLSLHISHLDDKELDVKCLVVNNNDSTTTQRWFKKYY